jgi:hypothetical protein
MATVPVECGKKHSHWIDVRRGENPYNSVWDLASDMPPPARLEDACDGWPYSVRSVYDHRKRVVKELKWLRRTRTQNRLASAASAKAEKLRVEFETLALQWRRETRHLSLVQKKITHPAYFRIVGMGGPVVPLLLEALRDRPAHWFAALRATANVDPCPPDANPAAARKAWLQWGRSQGLID